MIKENSTEILALYQILAGVGSLICSFFCELPNSFFYLSGALLFLFVSDYFFLLANSSDLEG